MIRINPLFCAKDLTISEGTGVPSLFHFHSRVLMCFHAPLRPRKMDKFLFLGTHTGFVTTKRIMTNIIEKNCLFCILSPVPLLPRALRNRSYYIDIPSTQHRSSKGSRRPTKARKPGSFRKWIPIRRVHNRMDKLTLTRQFRIQFEIFLERYREGIGME
ncbi:hypothetical protein L2E82_21685 [Cichorium intybus]|uniref:Uncharacterized protein n=1 Tax=Cichorium intybus TaxID=13427 RepID=A0ACB9DWJ1_CICIN|nr:hypothetical protein L2E82_21685 [Cichorium intybus]